MVVYMYLLYPFDIYRLVPSVLVSQAGGRSSSSSQHRHHLHLQQRMHGATRRRKGEARKRRRPNPAKIPITWNQSLNKSINQSINQSINSPFFSLTLFNSKKVHCLLTWIYCYWIKHRLQAKFCKVIKK